MAYQLFVRPEAEADLADTYRFYQECRLGLGADFVLCAEEAIERVQKGPFQCASRVSAPVSILCLLRRHREQDQCHCCLACGA